MRNRHVYNFRIVVPVAVMHLRKMLLSCYFLIVKATFFLFVAMSIVSGISIATTVMLLLLAALNEQKCVLGRPLQMCPAWHEPHSRSASRAKILRIPCITFLTPGNGAMTEVKAQPFATASMPRPLHRSCLGCIRTPELLSPKGMRKSDLNSSSPNYL